MDQAKKKESQAQAGYGRPVFQNNEFPVLEVVNDFLVA